MIRCYITDRASLDPGDSLLEAVARNVAAGVEWIQIRAKDAEARELFDLVEACLALANPRGSRFVVNTRVDVALAAGAGGAHLPAGSPAPRVWRGVSPAGFLIGASCHTQAELRQAEADGADYALFGPVFAPLSKAPDLEPRGLEGLRQACAAVRIPVLALGGVTHERIASCLAAGAAGIAGISLFQARP